MMPYVGTANLIRLGDSTGVQGMECFIDMGLLAQPADPRGLFGPLSAPASPCRVD